jgi:hypothetical protein
MKRPALCLLSVLGGSISTAAAEAFKNDIGLGNIALQLLLAFLLGPLGVGLGMYALLRASDYDDYEASAGSVLLFTFLAWWITLFVSDGNWVVVVVVAAVAAALGYYLTRHETQG